MSRSHEVSGGSSGDRVTRLPRQPPGRVHTGKICQESRARFVVVLANIEEALNDLFEQELQEAIGDFVALRTHRCHHMDELQRRTDEHPVDRGGGWAPCQSVWK